MEPQEIQTQTPNTVGSQPTQPSPKSATECGFFAVFLGPIGGQSSKAIRQTESGGNFQAKGASGEYGAYQWEPGTWSAESQQAGVNAPLDQATPEQQNEVAYTQIENWKKEGYNPAQIASMWNSVQEIPMLTRENFQMVVLRKEKMQKVFLIMFLIM